MAEVLKEFSNFLQPNVFKQTKTTDPSPPPLRAHIYLMNIIQLHTHYAHSLNLCPSDVAFSLLIGLKVLIDFSVTAALTVPAEAKDMFTPLSLS